MWIILRIFFGALMYWAMQEAKMNADANPMHGDLANAFWVAMVVIIAMANGIVWAPYFAEKVSDPLTGGMVESEYKQERGWLMKTIRNSQKRGRNGLARWLCFVEACRAPWRPAPFVIGLETAVEGSWLEKVYALEVFKFNNAQNCLKAYLALKRHGIDPRPHHSPGVNLVLISQEREVKESPAPLPAPTAPEPPKLERDKRIKLGLK